MASKAEELFSEWLQLLFCAKLLKVSGDNYDFKTRLSKVSKLYGRLDNAEQGEFSAIIAQYNFLQVGE